MYWEFVTQRSCSGYKYCNVYYRCKGWKIWSNGFGWMVINPSGHVYANEYKNLYTAKNLLKIE